MKIFKTLLPVIGFVGVAFGGVYAFLGAILIAYSCYKLGADYGDIF